MIDPASHCDSLYVLVTRLIREETNSAALLWSPIDLSIIALEESLLMIELKPFGFWY